MPISFLKSSCPRYPASALRYRALGSQHFRCGIENHLSSLTPEPEPRPTHPFGLSLSLPCVLLDHFLYLLLHPGKAEGGRSLHRRKFDGGFPELEHDLLDEHKPPTFPPKEFVEVRRGTFTKAQYWCPLERVLTNIIDFGHIGRDLRTGPAVRLVIELVLKIVVPQQNLWVHSGSGKAPRLW